MKKGKWMKKAIHFSNVHTKLDWETLQKQKQKKTHCSPYETSK